MIAPSGNEAFPSRYALMALSFPRIARISFRLPSSRATEMSFQLRYPGGILPMDGAPTTPASVAAEPKSKAIRFIVIASSSPDGISREDEVLSLHERMATMANLCEGWVAAFRFEAVRTRVVDELSISPPVRIRESLRVLHHQTHPLESVRHLNRIRRFRARLLRPIDLR